MKVKPVLLVAIVGAILPGITLASSLDEMKAEIEALKVQVAEAKGASGAVSSVAENIATAEEQIAQMMGEIPALEEEVERIGRLYEIYRSSYRVVSQMSAGQQLGTFNLKDGSVVSNAVYQGTARGGIKVTSTSGLITIPISEIPATLASNFNVPSGVTDVGGNVSELLASKPASAMTEAELAAAETAKTAPAPVVAANTSSGSAPVAAAPEEEDEEAKFKAMEERNKMRWAKIDEIRLEVEKNYLSQKEVKEARYRKEREFAAKRIPPDQGQVDSELGLFDVKLKNLREQEMELRAQMKRIRSDME